MINRDRDMPSTAAADDRLMLEALAEARAAAAMGEVPIGAVAIAGERIMGRAHNMREATQDPLGHAEMLVIAAASKAMGSWRLDDVTIYVTCEPCIMCAGAMLQARIPRVVFGCNDPKAGAMGSLYDMSCDPRLNHRIEVVRGVMARECASVLSEFFKGLRSE